MTEGTKSYLIGCHQFFLHPLCVLMAWRLEYKSWPHWWEIICIFLHDVGVCGRQYLSDDTAKKGHWGLGARMAEWLLPANFDVFSWVMIAGHCPKESGYGESKLFRADKRSWLVAPTWWLWWNYWVEWNGKGPGVTKPPIWKKIVAENLKSKNPIGSHELYLQNRIKREDKWKSVNTK